MKTKIGKVCAKHPALKGLRLLPSALCVECNREHGRKWRRANKAKVSAKRKAVYRMKADAIKAARKASYAANPEPKKKAAARWRKANPDKRAAYGAKRHALKKGLAVPLTAEEKQITAQLYATARLLTKITGEPYHVDHIIPLAKGGLHHPNNLQVLRGVDNLKKGVRV